MIISASRRTDIPSYYSDWFINRIIDEYVLVRNPMNFNQISKVSLKREDVECIVFWTKNPLPMFKYLSKMKEYNYYFQFSLTPYDKSIEKNLLPKSQLVSIFKQLSSKIGLNKVVWRYDPILLSDDIDINYHKNNFEVLAKKLKGSTKRCVISFLDIYPKISKKLREQNIRELTENQIFNVSKSIAEIGNYYDIEIQTCSENIDLTKVGIHHGKCIDDELIREIFGYSGPVEKDKNQRNGCGCVKSIDIGAYNSCCNGCVYCYANYDEKIIFNKNVNSPIIQGEITDDLKIINKKAEKCFSNQIKWYL